MEKTLIQQKTCPNCGCAAKYPTKHDTSRGYEFPTTYRCGSVDSPNWSPAIISTAGATGKTDKNT